MTPAQVLLLLQGEASLMGAKQAKPALSDADDLAGMTAGRL